MSPYRPFLSLFTGTYLLIAAPDLAVAQDGFPPGLELRPPAPGSLAPLPPVPSADPTPSDLGAVTNPLPFDFARQPTRWYADAETAVLFTGAFHFNGTFAAVINRNPVYVSPRVYIGRRLDGGGSIRFTYRNLTEVGRLGVSREPADGRSSSTTFTTNWFDLDYVSREFAPLDRWRLQWEAGGRFVFRYEDSRHESPHARYESSAWYFGGGPHLGLTSQILLGHSGWALFGRADTAVTFGGGEAVNRYRPLQQPPGWIDSPRSESTSLRQFQFDLGMQLALVRRWEWRDRALGFGVGVQGDVLTLGSLQRGPFSAFGVVNVGPFVRCEVGW